MNNILPANRTASLAAFIVGLAGCATSLAGVYPNPATNEVALILGGTATIAGPISHVIGSWFWDKRTTDLKIAELQLEEQRVQFQSMNQLSNSNFSIDNFKADFTNTGQNSGDEPEQHPDEGPVLYPGEMQDDPNLKLEYDSSIDLGTLDENYVPEHSLAPESTDTTQEATVSETGPEIQKIEGEA